jgi:hypothetical protein
MILSNLKVLGIVILITTFVFSNVQIHDYFSFASSQNNTSALSNMSNWTIPDEGLNNAINNTNSGNMSQIINASLSGATYSTFKNASTPSVAIEPNTNSLYLAYFKNETNGANLYIQKSTDMGKTFSQPVS